MYPYHPRERERKRERVSFVRCVRARARVICCTQWLFGLGFESHHGDPKFMHLLGREFCSTLLFVTTAREHVSRVSCVVHFVRFDMIDSHAARISDVSRLCIRGLWYSWLDQLNSGVLIQRDLTRMSRYTCIIRCILMYMPRYDVSLIRISF